MLFRIEIVGLSSPKPAPMINLTGSKFSADIKAGRIDEGDETKISESTLAKAGGINVKGSKFEGKKEAQGLVQQGNKMEIS
jgi:hypothetical protein